MMVQAVIIGNQDCDIFSVQEDFWIVNNICGELKATK